MLMHLISWLSGEKIPPGQTTSTLFSQGIGFGWGATLLVAGGALAWWSYRALREAVRPWQRRALWTLRLLSLAVLLVLLVQPAVLLKIEEKVRASLLVLIDDSQSMQIRDQRSNPEDLARAQVLLGNIAEGQPPSRAELVRALFSPGQAELWDAVAEKVDIQVAAFGAGSTALGAIQEGSGAAAPPALAQMAAGLKFDQPLTGLGDAVGEALDQWRGSPVAGIFMVTDGQSTTGSEPRQAAGLARAEKIPLLLYGTGVTSVRDLRIEALDLPKVAFAGEAVQARVQLRSSGLDAGTPAKVVVRLDGQQVQESSILVGGAAEQEITIGFQPGEIGMHDVEIEVAGVEGEQESSNNRAQARLRVSDEKVQLLYIEQKPRWDFRYIVNALKDDRRVNLSVVVLEGEPIEEAEGEQAFLAALPQDEAALLKYQVVLLGDVDPKAMGSGVLQTLRKLVDETGGGLIFLAGPHFNPHAYRGTPLEPLLPVDLAGDAGSSGDVFAEPRTLELTPAGRGSTLLRLDEDAAVSAQQWSEFPGLLWVAQGVRSKPTAESLLVLPPETPVIALQTYGRGQTLYFGTDETYRWRSGVGGKYFNRIWTQIIQDFALERLQGASATTQLRTDRAVYYVGDTVKIHGKIFDRNFQPLDDPRLEGELSREAKEGAPAVQSFALEAVAGNRGLYAGEWTARTPGRYRYAPLRDREAEVVFDVIARNAELLNPELDAATLQGMASESGGHFLRETDLARLPGLIETDRATIPREKVVALYHALPLLVLFIVFLCAEWSLRRLWQLK